MKIANLIVAPFFLFFSAVAAAAPAKALTCLEPRLMQDLPVHKIEFNPSRARAKVYLISPSNSESLMAKLRCSKAKGEVFFYKLGNSIEVQARVIRLCEEISPAAQDAPFEFELIELIGSNEFKGRLYEQSLAGPRPVADLNCK